MNKTIIITGGAGFIGSNLIEKLLNTDNNVICVDNLITGSKDNIKEFLDNENFQFIEHDITKPLDLKGDIDEIYNLACPASPKHYQKDPIFTLMTNVMGTKNMLDLAKGKNAKFLQASTSEVYGDPEQHPQKEEYRGNVSTTGPRACYDEGKRAAEALCFDYHRKKEVDIKVVRIFNTYGPKMEREDGRAIPNFINQALNNKPITVYGDGSQTRSFCYISDLVGGLLKIMNSNQSGSINLGNPEEYTILELVKIILDIVDSDSEIINKELPKDDPTKRRPDISKAKNILGWTPSINLEEGLKNTVDWFKN